MNTPWRFGEEHESMFTVVGFDGKTVAKVDCDPFSPGHKEFLKGFWEKVIGFVNMGCKAPQPMPGGEKPVPPPPPPPESGVTPIVIRGSVNSSEMAELVRELNAQKRHTLTVEENCPHCGKKL